jgi:hypothetical protein
MVSNPTHSLTSSESLKKQHIDQHGVDSWKASYSLAQQVRSVHWQGSDYPRVQFGDEPWARDLGLATCPDCGVKVGELHCFECENETCPFCRVTEQKWHAWSPLFCDHPTLNISLTK